MEFQVEDFRKTILLNDLSNLIGRVCEITVVLVRVNYSR